jgi:hypothetical protein
MSLHRRQLSSDLAAASNAIAGALVTAMFLVQIAVKDASATTRPRPEGRLAGARRGLGRLHRPRHAAIRLGGCHAPAPGAPFAISGALIAVALLALNLASFPTPPRMTASSTWAHSSASGISRS